MDMETESNVQFYERKIVAKKPLIDQTLRFNPREFEHERYLPVAKSVIGRVWSKIRVSIWIDTNGEEQKRADFKLFLYGGEPKYRCQCLFEQADDAVMLKKGDWIRVTGLDEIVVTYKKDKLFHNFKVIKMEILPAGYHLIDWRPLWEMHEQLMEENMELIQRVTALENMVFGGKATDEEMMTASDRNHARLMKKMQSLKPIVGDIYASTEKPYQRKKKRKTEERTDDSDEVETDL